jgi:hypothetical protein
VYDHYLHYFGNTTHHDEDNDGLDSNELAGWCVLNSSSSSRDVNDIILGLQGTCFTKDNPSYGVHLFLNIFSLYLKAKSENDGYGETADIFPY